MSRNWLLVGTRTCTLYSGLSHSSFISVDKRSQVPLYFVRQSGILKSGWWIEWYWNVHVWYWNAFDGCLVILYQWVWNNVMQNVYSGTWKLHSHIIAYSLHLIGRIRTTPEYHEVDNETSVLSLNLFPASYIQYPGDDRWLHLWNATIQQKKRSCNMLFSINMYTCFNP